MASGDAEPNYHSQLAAGTVDTVTLEEGFNMYEIYNVDGSARIDYTLDGSTPAEGGSATGRVLPATIAVDVVNVKSDGSTVVKLISTGTPHYSIQAVAGPED